MSSYELYEISIDKLEGKTTNDGALVVLTGKHTGRSVNDKFIVKDGENDDKIDWGNRYNSNYPLAISNLIIEQQISFKAAITVKKRFAKIVDKKSESEIMNMSNSDLQSIGISFRKAEYIKNVFYFFKSKSIYFDKCLTKRLLIVWFQSKELESGQPRCF